MRENPGVHLNGMLKLIKASDRSISPILEAVTNSLESILDLPEDAERYIEISLHFNDTVENTKTLESIEIKDSGTGFNSKAYARFNDLLDSSKGYRNRGTGRLQYFHRFDEMTVASNYLEDGNWQRRIFKCDKDTFIYDDELNSSEQQEFKTSVTLSGFKPQKKDHDYFSKLELASFVSLMKSQFALRAYLEKEKGVSFPKIIIKFSYQQPFLDKKGKIGWRKVEQKTPEKFKWLVFEFPKEEVDKHGAFLCSKDIPIEKVENPILKSSKGYLGNTKIAAFYGDYLDKPENVNDSVDSFKIRSKSDVKVIGSGLFEDDGYVYLDDIKRKADGELKVIYEEIAKAQKATEKNVLKLAKQLGISAHIAKKVQGIVKLTDDDDSITRSLHIEEAKYIADKSNKARRVINELDSLDPTSDEYQSEVQAKSREISELIDAQNKEELSKYVVRREIVATLLDKILAQELTVQTEELPKGKNRDREGIIHDLIFKRKSSNKVNDLWVLDEEFVHFDGFSELELSKMMLPTDEPLLKPEGMDEMVKLGFKPNRRPDIFLFAGEAKCVLVEFKEPRIDLSNYLQQMPKYCQLLANYSRIPIENFYCYLIGEEIEPEADLNEYEESVTGTWFRDSIPVREVATRNKIAMIRMEVLKLSDIAKRAHRRNHSFASKLGLSDLLVKSE